MKKSNKFILSFACIALYAVNNLFAQEHSIQFFRPNNKLGLHTFETTKTDTTPYKKLKVQLGGNFAQDFQVLLHRTHSYNTGGLELLKPGFNLPMANLNIDAQLEDGVRVNMTMYLSTRHHKETWVKGGYIQFDKLPFLKSALLDSLMKRLTIKVGFYELDYGDSHFRRTDGGNGIYNPFVENYIMDAFATEIGGELYYHSKNGFIAMAGLSNGQMNPTVSTLIDPSTGKPVIPTPAFHGKLGYDKKWNNGFRARLTASVYGVKKSYDNPLYFGDRAGSHYYYVMERANTSSSANAWSGRFDPQYTHTVETFVINPFIKYKGVELFGSFEKARGRMLYEKYRRGVTQYAIDVIYRFPKEKENFWIGARYNSLNANVPKQANTITINRAVASIGCFITKNILLKTEYVYQEYLHFDRLDIRYEGLFNGLMVEAAIGF